MGTYLKQNEVEGTKKKRGPKKQNSCLPLTTAEHVCKPTNLAGVEDALDTLASAVSRYVDNAATDGHNTLALFTGPEGSGHHPLLIALEPTSESTERFMEAFERMATAFERIADALTPKQG